MAFRLRTAFLVALALALSASAADAQGSRHKKRIRHGNDIYISKSNDDYLHASLVKEPGSAGPNDLYFQDTKEPVQTSLGSSFVSSRGFDLLPENRPPF